MQHRLRRSELELRGPRSGLEAAHRPSVHLSASIRNPPCGKCKIVSGARSLNCAGPGAASKFIPEAPQ
eukprot:9827827-Alexandrium_andersonii.AAC.1